MVARVEAATVLPRLSQAGRYADANWLPVLRTLDSGRYQPKPLAETVGMSREKLFPILDGLETAALATADGTEYTTTPTGSAVLAAFDCTTDAIGADAVQFLGGTENRPSILRVLAAGPIEQRDIVDTDIELSAETVRRATVAFEDRGWIDTDDAGRYVLTIEGRQVLAEFDRLRVAIEQGLAKAPFLNRIGSHYEVPSLATLRHAILVEPTVHDSNPMLDASLELANARAEPVERIRTVVPVFIPVMFEEFSDLVEWNTRFEIIFDRKTYEKLVDRRYVHYLVGSLASPLVKARVLNESVTYGVGLYDDAMLASSRTDADDPGVGIRTTHPSPYRWGETLFETHWEAGTDLKHVVGETVIRLAKQHSAALLRRLIPRHPEL